MLITCLRRFWAVATVSATVVAVSVADAGELKLEARDKTIHGIAVTIDGKLFADYVIGNGPKPYVWPIVGPTGKEMTRAYSMKYVEGEKTDHPHQRSFWFTHGDVNGVDFWAESRGDGSPVPGAKEGRPAFTGHGKIVHREYLKNEVVDGAAVISTINDWVSPTGKKILEDERTLVFRDGGEWRSIDFNIILKATDGDVRFGETKEGSFGVRVPTVMDVDHKPAGGKIVTSEGKTDKDAWGTRAPWVDYSGVVDGDHLGIAVLNHPSSFRYPTRWHVRTYGLFAANPFGATSFDPKTTDESGATVKSGESITLRYRVIFHKGDAESADIAAAFKAYSVEK
jgi:hypothetical protein